MIGRRAVFQIAAFLALFTISALAQDVTPLPPGTDGGGALLPLITIEKRVDEVNLAFTVTDKKGHFISNLHQSDFDVLDGRLTPQAFRYFQQQSDLPLNVALLIDASDSVQYRFKFEQRAAASFLKSIIRGGQDKAMVVAFNNQVHLVNGLTDNVDLLAREIKRVQAKGETALYDAITFACTRLRNSPPGTRRAIIIISDGVDTASRALLYDAQDASARAQVTAFALSTNDLAYDSYPKGEAVLDMLTQPTGGRILPARDESQVTKAFREVEKTLRNQYALAYLPAEFKPDGSFRRVQIIPRKHGLKVQCRRGYFARREEGSSLVLSSK